jgi:hypothetical protein
MKGHADRPLGEETQPVVFDVLIAEYLAMCQRLENFRGLVLQGSIGLIVLIGAVFAYQALPSVPRVGWTVAHYLFFGGLLATSPLGYATLNLFLGDPLSPIPSEEPAGNKPNTTEYISQLRTAISDVRSRAATARTMLLAALVLIAASAVVGVAIGQLGGR